MSTVTDPVIRDVTGRQIAAAILATSVVPIEVTVDTDGDVTAELNPNTAYHFTGNLSRLTITLAPTTGTTQYHFDFLAGSNAPTLVLPASVITNEFTVIANRRYEIDILNNYGVVQWWTVSS